MHRLRRSLLATAVVLPLLPIAPRVTAQTTENQAPELPALGTALKLPPITRLDGTAFDPREAAGRELVLYW